MSVQHVDRQFLWSLKKYLLLGFVIREGLSFWTGHDYDFEIWVRLGVYMQHLGNPYTTLSYVQGLSFAPYPLTGSISYPPLSAFIFAGIYRLYLSTGVSSRFFYYFLLKQPMVLSDFAAGIVLGGMALHSSGDALAKRVLKIWMLFPYAIFVSSVWGALDPIALFLILGSVYYFQQDRVILSGITLGLAIWLKTLPVIALPVLLIHPSSSFKERLQLSSLSLVIPALGTVVPAVGLGWGFNGMFKSFSYQAIVPMYGALSPLDPLNLLSVPVWARNVIGLIWLPAIVGAYYYIGKRRLGLIEGLLTAFLVFSVSRPFLPEAWAIYPLAFLLLSKNAFGNFAGLAMAGFSELVANNNLLVRFLSPISLAAFNWDVAVSNSGPLIIVRIITTSLLSGLFLVESILALTGRPSVTFHALSAISFKVRRLDQLKYRSTEDPNRIATRSAYWRYKIPRFRSHRRVVRTPAT